MDPSVWIRVKHKATCRDIKNCDYSSSSQFFSYRISQNNAVTQNCQHDQNIIPSAKNPVAAHVNLVSLSLDITQLIVLGCT